MDNPLAQGYVAPGSRFAPRRLALAALRRVPLLGSSHLLDLAQKNFELRFHEEALDGFKLSPTKDRARSASLWDQREALFRALVVEALKRGVIDRRRNFIDVGACNGDTAIPWALLIEGRVFAIDPSEANIAFIRRFAGRHSISNIEATTAAIGEKEGKLYPVCDVAHTAFSEEPLTRYGARHPVNAVTFDILYAAGRISDVGFLHLDVEGMELAALRGAADFIAGERPVIAFESHLTIDDTDAIFAILRDAHYQCFMINEVTPGGRPDCVNFLAFPAAVAAADLEALNRLVPVQPYYKAVLGPNLIPS